MYEGLFLKQIYLFGCLYWEKSQSIQIKQWETFLSGMPTMTHSFLTPISIFRINFTKRTPGGLSRHTLSQITWPDKPCSALSCCFMMLESFIREEETWKSSRCTRQELSYMEKNLNKLLHFLQIQKTYANQFWALDLRRVEASVTHFYCFLQYLVRSVIPYANFTLFQCKTTNKLCFKLIKLQNMVNCIFKKVNEIASFLSEASFQEQHNLIVNFLQNVVQFLKAVPKIKRNRLNHVHKLIHYVVLSNPIEICFQPKQRAIRKKSNTISANQIKEFKEPILRSAKVIEIKPIKLIKRTRSCSILQPQQKANAEAQGSYSKLFRFPEKILGEKYLIRIQKPHLDLSFSRRSSLKENNRKKTNISFITADGDKAKKKERRKQRFKTATNFSVMNRIKSIQGLSPTKNYYKKERRDTIATNQASEKSFKFYEEETERRDTVSKDGSLYQKMRVFHIDSQEARLSKTISILCQEQEKYKQISISNGNFQVKGWGLVRQYFLERLALRNLAKLREKMSQ